MSVTVLTKDFYRKYFAGISDKQLLVEYKYLEDHGDPQVFTICCEECDKRGLL